MCLWATLVTPYFRKENDGYPVYYYIITYIIYLSLSTINAVILVTVTTFFTRIADVRVGGTYFSILYTAYNMGKNLFYLFSYFILRV